MENLILVIKIIVVAIFLVMFLRGNKLLWGIGLLTVTTAVLLDTFLGTFNREEMVEELGFFFHIINGALFAGAFVWLWGLLRPITADNVPGHSKVRTIPSLSVSDVPPAWSQQPVSETRDTAYDRQMLYEQIRYRFSPEDVLDLIFDLGLNENDVIALNQETHTTIIKIIDVAEERGQTGNLALAVERILTPIPRDTLPRLEKLSSDSPQTVLRYYINANYTLGDLQDMSTELGVDWQMLGGSGKQTKVRNLLLYLYRRNRIEELIDLLKRPLDEEE